MKSIIAWIIALFVMPSGFAAPPVQAGALAVPTAWAKEIIELNRDDSFVLNYVLADYEENYPDRFSQLRVRRNSSGSAIRVEIDDAQGNSLVCTTHEMAEGSRVQRCTFDLNAFELKFTSDPASFQAVLFAAIHRHAKFYHPSLRGIYGSRGWYKVGYQSPLIQIECEASEMDYGYPTSDAQYRCTIQELKKGN